MMWRYYGGWGGGLWGFGGLLGLCLWVLLLIWLLYALLGHSKKEEANPPTPSPTPLDILKKRYAQGDISKKDFEIMKKDLA